MGTCAGENCTYDLGLTKSKSICCDNCKEWLCMDCSKIPQKVFEAVITASKTNKDLSMITFCCSSCKTTATLNQIKDDVQAIKFEIIKAINDNSMEIKTHMDNKAAENFNELKNHSIKQKESFADIIKKHKPPSIETINIGVKKVLDSTAVATKEQEHRDQCIMLFNKEESKAENSKGRSKEELDFVKDFIKEGLKITAVEIETTNRIGRFDPNKQRPIRVKFTNRTDQQKVLLNLGNLKVAEARFKGIFVTIDRNQHQREEMKNMLQEAKEKSDASEDKFYLVRGSPFKPQIVEVEKRK